MKANRRVLSALLLVGGAAHLAAPVHAQADDASFSNAIVVTGERFERSILETAASVAVFDDQRLTEQAGADRVEQLLDLVPNVQRGAGDTGIAIRGQDTTGVLIGANAFLGGTRPRATLQLDGRALSFNEFMYGLSSTWDVERIEVFRGPQTTTQGRNAIAGAIFIETKDPTFDFEGAAQAIVGNFETRQASLALSGPVVQDQLAARFSVDWREHESWVNFAQPDVFVGANRENDDFLNARAKLLFAPAAIPELELLLTYSHLDVNTPQNEVADEPYEDRLKTVQNGAHWDTRVDSLVLRAGYGFSDAWEVDLTGSYADSRVERFASPGVGEAVIQAEEYSIEGLLRFDPVDAGLRGLVGISYFTSEQSEISDFSAFLGLGDFSDDQESFGLFGEATLDLTPKLHLTVGGRWQEDSQDRSGTLGFVALDYDETFNAFLPKAEIAYEVTDEIVVGATARRGFNPGGTTISFVTGDIDDFEAETLWSYELFTRASLANGDLILTGNLFYTDFTNAQRPLITIVDLPGGGTAEFTQFSNAPSAESYGFELESVWRASPVLQLRASLGIQDSKITETLLPNDPILGQQFQRAPRFTGSLGMQVQPVEPFTLNLNLRHNSSYYSDDANTLAYKVEGVTVLDAKATYNLGLASFFAFVRNATDENYRVWQFQPGNSSLGDPREYGIGIEARF